MAVTKNVRVLTSNPHNTHGPPDIPTLSFQKMHVIIKNETPCIWKMRYNAITRK